MHGCPNLQMGCCHSHSVILGMHGNIRNMIQSPAMLTQCIHEVHEKACRHGGGKGWLPCPLTSLPVFDGWTSRDNTHCMSVFATFVTKADYGYSKVLLTVLLIGEKDSLAADEHFKFASYILQLYQYFGENVCLVGGNSPTSKTFANRAKKPLVGYASHQLNRTIKDLL